MAPAHVMVFLSQKHSTENGQFRVVVLRLAWKRPAQSVTDVTSTLRSGRRLLACLTAPARIKLKAQGGEFSINGEKYAKRWVRFAYKTQYCEMLALKLWRP